MSRMTLTLRAPDQAPVRSAAVTPLIWAPNQVHALLGPPGSGKSALLDVLAGRTPSRQWQLWFDDRCVDDVPTRKRNVAHLTQNAIVHDTMTVAENLAFPLRNRGVARQHIRQRITAVARPLGLMRLLSRPAGTLGREDRRATALGRALIRDDSVAILLDDPLAGLPEPRRLVMLDAIAACCEHDMPPIILATDHPADAMGFADSITVMHHGLPVQTATPRTLHEWPAHRSVGLHTARPGMNFIACKHECDAVVIGDHHVALPPALAAVVATIHTEDLHLGIRPEAIQLVPADEGMPVTVERVEYLGTYQLVEVDLVGQRLMIRLPEDAPVPNRQACIDLPQDAIRLYADDWLVPVPTRTRGQP